MNLKRILEQADTCVKCGLCLPHCPTYRLSEDENESPRGRIALVQGLLTGQLTDSERVQRHIGRCLICRNCESACPSNVPVTDIFDSAKRLHAQALPLTTRLFKRSLLALAMRPGFAARLVQLYKRSGLRRLARASGLLRLLGLYSADRLLESDLHRPARTRAAAPATPTAGHVAIFTGCIGRYLDGHAIEAATDLLQRLGYRVSIPEAAHCCGALHRHEGFVPEAQRKLNSSSVLFGQTDYDAVVSLASACAGELADAPDIGPKVHELTRFLADCHWPEEIPDATTRVSVLIHTPCTQRNVLRDPGAALDLLSRFPGLDIAELPDNDRCCGAAGAFMLREPALSAALLDGKLTSLRRLGPDYLVTTNSGCAAHLRAGIAEAGLRTRVLHPAELAARLLMPDSGTEHRDSPPLDRSGAERENSPSSQHRVGTT